MAAARAEADCRTRPQTGDIQSVAMRPKCLLVEIGLARQSAGFNAIFNGANYSNGMGSDAGNCGRSRHVIPQHLAAYIALGVFNFNNGGKYEDNDLQTTRRRL